MSVAKTASSLSSMLKSLRRFTLWLEHIFASSMFERSEKLVFKVRHLNGKRLPEFQIRFSEQRDAASASASASAPTARYLAHERAEFP